MTRFRLAILAAAAVALAGCASVPAPLSVPLVRSNGQPLLLPCMVGDALCH